MRAGLAPFPPLCPGSTTIVRPASGSARPGEGEGGVDGALVTGAIDGLEAGSDAERAAEHAAAKARTTAAQAALPEPLPERATLPFPHSRCLFTWQKAQQRVRAAILGGALRGSPHTANGKACPWH
jgi:hypothetical protein